ncbi:MAG: DUF4398 domain-containing protein [Proteobacteria bacterium]|nr:MAG: DUF4398 domain-containing protein [Pseudomonadota bacterium]
MNSNQFVRAALFTAMLGLGACASTSPKYSYSPTANGATEVQSLEAEFQRAQKEDVPVLSPKHYKAAESAFADAKAMATKGKDNDKVLERLGYAKGHLDAAFAAASGSRESVKEIIKVRRDAINAKAPEHFGKDFNSIDNDFRDITSNFENGKMAISVEERSKLQRDYMDIELKSIKRNELGSAMNLIGKAKDMKAEKMSPQSLTEAQAKVKAAEMAIESNRHNDTAYRPAVNEANLAAQKAFDINEIVRNSKGKSAEQIAMEIQKRSEAMASQRNDLATQSSKISARDSAIASLSSKNAQLSARERLDKSLEKARGLFTKSEADVYRQGDQLLIRLKQVQFPTGRTELPQSSFTTLAKTKDVIAMLGAEKVVVEGHTDSVGGKEANQKLSQERADAIAKYLVTQDIVTNDQVQAEGFGFDKPLASNKTKTGRAQNRRVDLVITPAAAAPKSSTAE